MTLQVMNRDAVRGLIAKLMEETRVVAPHEREGVRQWAFEDVTDPAKVTLEYIATILPPKKYAFPPKESLVHYQVGDKPTIEPVIECEPMVLFGVHPCDLHGMQCLDMAFEDKNVDPNYCARRSNMRVVGVDCEHDEYCFCSSMGTCSISEGYDLFLTPVHDEYLVEVATPAGEEMVQGIPMREATGAEVGLLKERLAHKMQQGERRIHCDVSSLPLFFQGFAESEVWKKWAEKCYSCGTCNLTCPTCYCFDVLDEMDLSLSSGKRVREWDGCMLEDFAAVASGENFREDREERLRHRFFRKYAYLFTRYGKPYCTGCGRCVRQCLVDIDPVGVINDLLAESRKGAFAHG